MTMQCLSSTREEEVLLPYILHLYRCLEMPPPSRLEAQVSPYIYSSDTRSMLPWILDWRRHKVASGVYLRILMCNVNT
jgi:hypothetical protein